ncbi:MAG: ThiF domain protein [Verrucomicrobiales bacterium]|nr:ThiF domain protein [Verrucomicrobiales bacterium]
MSSVLISRSPDLTRLQNEGFDLDVVGGYLVVRQVPYVTAERTVAHGDLVCELTLAGDRTTMPSSHVMYFTGHAPCHLNGSPITAIQHGEAMQQFGPGLSVQRSFSNKPADGYADYYHKVARYAEIISGPAVALDAAATARPFRPISNEQSGSPFVYSDTNSARGHFQAVSGKLAEHKVGIVGAGGTGSYVLDLVAKTPVAEIRLFDADLFLQHNAFRAPGAASIEELQRKPTKVAYLAEVYSRMHRGVKAYAERMGSENLSHLEGLNFVFLCLDSGPAKKDIVEFLVEKDISFIDCGIGVQSVDDRLIGIVRVTAATPKKHDHLEGRVSFAEPQDDAYSTNIQIAELNMLNAALAVIKWKKFTGFYADFEHEHHTTYSIDTGMLTHEQLQP